MLTNNYSIPNYSDGMTGNWAVARAYELYRCVFRQGVVRRFLLRLLGRPTEMREFRPSGRQERLAGRYLGNKTVPLKKIQGSEGRSTDFDRFFNPIHENSLQRWANVAAVQIMGQSLPAVELLQVDGIYYVRDGHHRISVARAMGQAYIDATVTAYG
jgi:hypothetical protein